MPDTLYHYIQAHFPANTPILDVGSESGTNAQALLLHGYTDLHAVEPYAPNVHTQNLQRFYKSILIAPILQLRPTHHKLVLFNTPFHKLTRPEMLLVLHRFSHSTCVVTLPLTEEATPEIIQEHFHPKLWLSKGPNLAVFITGVLP